MRTLSCLALVASVACGGSDDKLDTSPPGPTTDTTTGGPTGTNPPATTTTAGPTGNTNTTTGGTSVFEVKVFGVDTSCGAYVPEELTGGVSNGAINVLHVGVVGPQTADWEVSGTADTETMRIDMVYQNVDTGSTSVPDCWFSIDYLVDDIPTGSWILAANGQELAVDVP